MNRDRDKVFLELTRSTCPVCKTTIDAEANARDDKVCLRKRCAGHGEFEALVYGDAQMYVDIQRFNKPGTRPLTTQTEVKDGCPSDCGLCPEHKQHACLGVIEVNTGCNLACPICFADSGHQPDGYAITQDQCALMLDTFVAAEGEPELVMFSGGEPTIHKDILAMVDLAQARRARDRPHRPARPAPPRRPLGRVPAGHPLRASRRVRPAHPDDQLRRPARHRRSAAPVVHRRRLFPVPCCAPTCRSITYLLTQGQPDDPDFGLVPIPRLLQVEDYLDYVTNRVVPDYAIREALERLWSASAFPGTDTNDDRLTTLSNRVAEALDCADACGVNLPEALAGITENAFMIVVQDFLDPYTLNIRQLMKGCVEEITPDGRLIPICAYNSVGYREQVRAQMTGVPVDPIIPNALPLQPVLIDGPHGAKRAHHDS